MRVMFYLSIAEPIQFLSLEFSRDNSAMHLLSAALDDQLNEILSISGPFLFYMGVWALVFAGTGLLIGVFIPFITGDSLLFAAGLIAAASDNINIVILAVGVGFAAFLGDQVGFVLGRHYGRPYLERRTSPKIAKWVRRTEAFYERYGWSAVVVARFMPWARALIPVIAGIGRMNYYKFLSANLVGALLWGVGMSFVGYWAATIPVVKNAAYAIGFTFITISVIAGVRSWRADKRKAEQDLLASTQGDEASPAS
jgi:membrane-associated protein